MEGHIRGVVLAAALLSLLVGVFLTGSGAVQAGNHGTTTAACTFDHVTLWTPDGVCRPRAIRYPPSVSGRIKHAIYDSALIFGIPYSVLLKVARCESGLNPRAAYAGHFGLYQFLPATFHEGAKQLRSDTGITARTYWSALDASYVAGYLFAVGQSPRWSCN